MNLQNQTLVKLNEKLSSTPTINFALGYVKKILEQLLPPDFFCDSSSYQLLNSLPLFCWTPIDCTSTTISFYLCSPLRTHCFRFFQDLISKGLIPGKKICPLHQVGISFSFPCLPENAFLAAELVIPLGTAGEIEAIRKNLGTVVSEIRRGVNSEHHANQILSTKGLSLTEKEKIVQSEIASLLQKKPHYFDFDLSLEMQRFFLTASDAFKLNRSFKQLCRIICCHYFFRKALRFSHENFPDSYEVSVKMIRSELMQEGKKKKVLGIILGMTGLKSSCLFEERHFMSAIKHMLPTAYCVDGSYLSLHKRDDPVQLFYLEISKAGGFTPIELAQLKSKLSDTIKNHVEERHPQVFMLQNEEETLRQIVALSKQLQFFNDLPQAITTFITQSETHLEFQVIFARILKKKEPTIQELFDEAHTSLEYFPDRIKIVGLVRKKYPKEISVFRVKIGKKPYLRKNHSIDLYRTRQAVVADLKKVIGDFRDYNGGTISKEVEVFAEVCKQLGTIAQEQSLLLEDFFFALHPAIIRSVFPPSLLKALFVLLLKAEKEAKNSKEPYLCHIIEKKEYVLMAVSGVDQSFKKRIVSSIEGQKAPALLIGYCLITHLKKNYFALIAQIHDASDSVRLRHIVEKCLDSWSLKKRNS